MRYFSLLIFFWTSSLYAMPLPSTTWSSARISETLVSLRAGTFLENGAVGIATLSQHRLTIYRLEDDSLKEVAHLDGHGQEDWIKLSSHDFNDDGQEEIIISAVSRESAFSFSVTVEGEKIVRKQEFKKYISSITWNGQKQMASQLRRDGDDFTGPLIFLKAGEKGIVEAGKMKWPTGMSGESFSLYSIQGFKPEGQPQGFVQVAASGKIHYFVSVDEGQTFKRQWTSGSEYGGNVIYLDRPLTNALQEVTATRMYVPLSFSFEDQGFFKSIKPLPVPPLLQEPEVKNEKGSDQSVQEPERLAAWSPPVIVPQINPNHLYVVKNEGYLNNVIGAVASVKNTQVIRLTWTGYGFQEDWNSPRFDGAFTDFQVIDWDGDGKPEILATLLLRDKGYADTLKRQDSLIVVIDIPSEGK